MDGDAISSFQSAKIPQQRRHFIHAIVEFLVRDGDRRDIFRLAHKDKCSFVPILLKMTIDTVVTGVEFAAGIPLPERSVTGIKRGVPILVPAQKVCIFTEAFGEILFAEALINGGISEISLTDKFRAWVEVLLFFPMNSDLRLIDLCLLFFFLHYASVSHGMD